VPALEVQAAGRWRKMIKKIWGIFYRMDVKLVKTHQLENPEFDGI